VVGNLQKALAGPGIITYQVEMTKKNGEPIDLEVNGIPLKKDSKVAGVLAVLKMSPSAINRSCRSGNRRL